METCDNIAVIWLMQHAFIQLCQLVSACTECRRTEGCRSSTPSTKKHKL